MKKQECRCEEFDLMRADRDMFQAQVAALIPLARLGLGGLDGGSYYSDYLYRLGILNAKGEETRATMAARAILPPTGS